MSTGRARTRAPWRTSCWRAEIGRVAAVSRVEPVQAWTYPAETPADESVGEEFLFANASLYWFTASAGTAALEEPAALVDDVREFLRQLR